MLINQELEGLNKNVKIIATNSINKISTFSNAKKNISNLLRAFDDLKDLRKRIIFKIRSKRGLDPSSVEYMKFEKKITGGACMEDGERGWFTDLSETTCIPQAGTGISLYDLEDSDTTGSIQFLNNNLFYNMHLLTTTMDGILSSESNYNIDQDFNISVDYLCAQPELISIVLQDRVLDMLCGKIVQINKTELPKNAELPAILLNDLLEEYASNFKDLEKLIKEADNKDMENVLYAFDSHFKQTFKSINDIGKQIIESQEYASNFNDLEKLIKEADNKDMQNVLYAFDSHFKQTFKSINDVGKQIIESQVYADRFSENSLIIAKTLADINTLINHDLDEVNQSVKNNAGNFITIVLIISLIGLLIILFFGIIISRLITRPVNELVVTSMDIAQGESDLTKRIEVKGKDELSELSSWFNMFLERLNNLVIDIKTHALNMAVSSKEIASGNQDLSSRTTQQSTSLEETATSMEEINSIVQNSAEDAKNANEITQKAQQTVVDSRTQLLDTVNDSIEMNQEMLQNLQTTNKSVVEAMEEIMESSKKIEGIITLMNDIAFQTNLLALNASVEAARAGEHGKGFAVVASEVRKLAHRSAKASKEIGELIQTSLERINSGRNLVKDGEQGMDDMRTKMEIMLNNLKSESDSNLNGILQSVKEVSEVMENIKVASEEQAEGVDQINRTIADMDRITQENSALVEQNTTASQHMAEEAAHLQTLINAFKVEEEQSKALENGTTQVGKDKPELRNGKIEQIPEHTGAEKLNDPPESTGRKTLPPFK